jgi:hypothetical protein
MTVIEIEDKTAKALLAQAQARDLTLDAFLALLAQNNAPVTPVPALEMSEFEKVLDEIVADVPGLPQSFSRADIYADHD